MAEEGKLCPSRVVRKFSASGRAEEKRKGRAPDAARRCGCDGSDSCLLSRRVAIPLKYLRGSDFGDVLAVIQRSNRTGLFVRATVAKDPLAQSVSCFERVGPGITSVIAVSRGKQGSSETRATVAFASAMVAAAAVRGAGD